MSDNESGSFIISFLKHFKIVVVINGSHKVESHGVSLDGADI